MTTDEKSTRAFVRAASKGGSCEVRAILSPVQSGPLRYHPPPEARTFASGGCPVLHTDDANRGTRDDRESAQMGGTDSYGCPMHKQEDLDARNMMPPADRLGGPQSDATLPTDRQVSSIPMGSERPRHQDEEVENWQYPSQQMFYNAMKRKGWDPKEEDMPAVVAIHNAVNERVWEEIGRWERMHDFECDCPKLLRFRGRPRDYSPKARILNFLGYKLPFDRHDWIVDRCGKEVRYVIDFYNSKASYGLPAAMYLDVRPALDSVENAWDRIAMQVHWMFSLRWLREARSKARSEDKTGTS